MDGMNFKKSKSVKPNLVSKKVKPTSLLSQVLKHKRRIKLSLG